MNELTAKDLDALPELARVTDAYGDVSEKRNGLWHSFETAPLWPAKLVKYGPIRLAPGDIAEAVRDR